VDHVGRRIGGKAVALMLGSLLSVAACGGKGGSPAPPVPPAQVHWSAFLPVSAVVDLTGPRGDGRLTVAAGGHLSLLRPGGQPEPFARGGGGYATDPAPEPYLTLTGDAQLAGAGCGFHGDTVFAIEPTGRTGVLGIDPTGLVRRLADLPATPYGITFDDIGHFGHRLLVTVGTPAGTSLYGIDCAGHVSRIAERQPPVEGGIAVAPLSFGAFGGDLIAPDEKTGRIWAFGPDGGTRLVATSPLPHGNDIGVETVGFVPAGFGRDWSAYVADRRSPGNPHPGSDAILRLSGADLAAVDVRPGDLVAVSEGGALTSRIRCTGTDCPMRYIADGPPVAHVEGHLAFAPGQVHARR
jgi:hypothetical protein